MHKSNSQTKLKLKNTHFSQVFLLELQFVEKMLKKALTFELSLID